MPTINQAKKIINRHKKGIDGNITMVRFATIKQNGHLVMRDESGQPQQTPPPQQATVQQQSETQQQAQRAPSPLQPQQQEEGSNIMSHRRAQQSVQSKSETVHALAPSQQENASITHQQPQQTLKPHHAPAAAPSQPETVSLISHQRQKKRPANVGPLGSGGDAITTNNNYLNHGQAKKKKSAIVNIENSNGLEFIFNVDIPSYYRNNKNTADVATIGENEEVIDAAAQSEDEKMAGIVMEEHVLIGQADESQHSCPKGGDQQEQTSKIDDVEIGGLPSEHSPTEQSSEKAGTHPNVSSNQSNQDNSNNQSTKHNNFITALEKHGSSVGAWESIAFDLNWTIEEVQVYAYSYFKSIVRYGNTKKKSNSTQQDNASWSFQDYILLDSLMLKYCTDLSCLKNNAHVKQKKDSKMSNNKDDDAKQSTVWDKIACQLPGKTADMCRKVGTLRLLKLYRESKERGKGDGVR